jgi:hypothetical protein
VHAVFPKPAIQKHTELGMIAIGIAQLLGDFGNTARRWGEYSHYCESAL